MRQVKQLFPVQGAQAADRLVIVPVECKHFAFIVVCRGRGKQGFDPVVFLEDSADALSCGVVPLNGCRDGVRRYQRGKFGIGL